MYPFGPACLLRIAWTSRTVSWLDQTRDARCAPRPPMPDPLNARNVVSLASICKDHDIRPLFATDTAREQALRDMRYRHDARLTSRYDSHGYIQGECDCYRCGRSMPVFTWRGKDAWAEKLRRMAFPAVLPRGLALRPRAYRRGPPPTRRDPVVAASCGSSKRA